MRFPLRYVFMLGMLMYGLSIATAGPLADGSRPISLVADPNGEILYLAGGGIQTVSVFDIENQKFLRKLHATISPNGMAISPDGTRLYVTGNTTFSYKGDSLDDLVCRIDLTTGNVIDAIQVGHTPHSPVPSPDGKTLFVCNRFNNNVSVIDLRDFKEIARIPAVREPVAAAITPNGHYLFVANLLSDDPATADCVSAKVTVIDARSFEKVRDIPLPNGSTSLRGITVSPDGRHVFVTHILARYQLPTTQLDRGWMNTNAFSILDAQQASYINTVLLDNVDMGAANPWGIACSADGKTLCVAQAGSNDISIIDLPGLLEKLEAVKAGKTSSAGYPTQFEDIPNDISFLTSIRQRIPVLGKGPREVAIVGNRVYATEYFSGSVASIALDSIPRPRANSLLLEKEIKLTGKSRGEQLFHDASLCFQKWQSCVSCHPGNGRADSLNWDLLNDGIGNPKNTKSLLLAHQTPPSMISGVRDKAETAVRSGIRYIQFAERPDEDAQDIDLYLQSLQPVPSPHLRQGELNPSARSGQKIFEAAKCNHCHPAPLYTNLQKYNIGTGTGRESEMEFDTPTLIELWRTAPYLNDGRARTLKEVFTRFNPNNRHGETSELTEAELNDLVEFLLSL